jgi:DNA-binding MarR family transcriptional regulator
MSPALSRERRAPDSGDGRADGLTEPPVATEDACCLPKGIDINVDINDTRIMKRTAAQNIGSVCLGLHIRRAARGLTRHYDAALAPVALTIGQFSLMTMLAAQDFWAMQPLADALGTDRSSLTASLKPLERRGLVVSSPDKQDRRLRFLSLTAEGSTLMEEAQQFWSKAQREAEDLIGPAEVASLRQMLNALA